MSNLEPLSEYTDLQIQRSNLISHVLSSMRYMYNEYCNLSEKDVPYNKRVNYSVKENKENNTQGQYGYYISSCGSSVDRLISKYKIKSLVDLGIGAGVLISVLKAFNPDVNFHGFDIEDSLLQYCTNVLGLSASKKDLLTLERKDISCFDALYFWEPLHDKELAKQFVNNLENIVVKGQYIFYLPSGYIGDFLRERKNLKEIYQDNRSGIYVFQVQ